MLNKVKLFTFLILIIFGLLATSVSAQAVGVTDVSGVLEDLNQTAEYAKMDTDATAYQIVGFIINLVLGFLSALFLVLIIFGGITWMTAAGNAEKVTKASSLITHAAIGLIIIVFAFLLTNFVVFRIIGISTSGSTASPNSQDEPENTDQACIILQGSECQIHEPGAITCTVTVNNQTVQGHYVSNLCLSNSNPLYRCCVPNEP